MIDKPTQDIQAMDFETAFNALQENLAKLEGEDLPLEQTLSLFEHGQALAKHCAMLLEQAELKLRTLTIDSPDVANTKA